MLITRTVRSSLLFNLGKIILIIYGILALYNKDNIWIITILSYIFILPAIVLIGVGWGKPRLYNRKIKKASMKFKQLQPHEVKWKMVKNKDILKPYKLVCDTIYGNFSTVGTDIIVSMKLFNIYKDELKNRYYVEVIL